MLPIVLAVVALGPATAAAQGPGGAKPAQAPAEPTAIPVYAGVAPVPRTHAGRSRNRSEVRLPDCQERHPAHPRPSCQRPARRPARPSIVAPGGAFLMLSIDSEGYQGGEVAGRPTASRRSC